MECSYYCTILSPCICARASTSTATQQTVAEYGQPGHSGANAVSTVPYQERQRSFSSHSGSGHTVWYSSKSNTSILVPPRIPHAKTGHIYVHLDTSRDTPQYWMFGIGNVWERVSPGAEYPLNHDRVLATRANGEPSWVTRASVTTTKTRKEKEIREKSVQG
jgi:hypothetical protein